MSQMGIDLRGNPFYLDDEAVKWVEDTLSGMTVRQKAGQLFCVLFKEAKPSELEYVKGDPGARRVHVQGRARKTGH